MIEGLTFHTHAVLADQPLISLVVPVYNEKECVGHFAAAIETVIAESWSDGALATSSKSGWGLKGRAARANSATESTLKSINAAGNESVDNGAKSKRALGG
jgi:hypothetical protein